MRPDFQYREDLPVIEVRVYSGDRLVDLEFCEDQVEVAEVVDRWTPAAGVSFLVDEFHGVDRGETLACDGIAEPDSRTVPAFMAGAGWE